MRVSRSFGYETVGRSNQIAFLRRNEVKKIQRAVSMNLRYFITVSITDKMSNFRISDNLAASAPSSSLVCVLIPELAVVVMALCFASPLSTRGFTSQFLPLKNECLCDQHSTAPVRRRVRISANVAAAPDLSPTDDNNLEFEPFGNDEEDVYQNSWDEVDARLLPCVAVVGRPNVGKSTLVNRLASEFQGGSIVADVEGITRDRTYRRSFWNGVDFTVVDTGGLVFDDNSTMLSEIRTQALLALEEASAAILVVDGRVGCTVLDEQLGNFLRRECKIPVFIAVNKCDSRSHYTNDFWSLGLDEPISVSAIHGVGTGDLLDKVVEKLPRKPVPKLTNVTNVAIVGRPNVGKSSLLNAMLGVERAIVADAPGTTRDAVDELIERNGKTYRLIDTAGIRRRTNVEQGTEYYMVNRAMRAIRRADVALLMVDVNEGAAEQDRKIADRIADEGTACVLLGNKWDLVEDKDNKSYKKGIEQVRDRVSSIPWATVELISVKEKKRINQVLELVDKAREQHIRRVSTSVLNEVLRDAVEWHRPPVTRGGRSGRIYYCTQVSSRPPTIAMFVNDPRLFTDNYRRFMEGRFRSQLGFGGTPIRVLWRGKDRAPDGF